MPGKIRDLLRGLRQIEILVLVVLIALACIFLLDNNTAVNGNETELESRLKDIIVCIDGIKDPEVMIAQSDEGIISGAVIVARGVDDVKNYLNVQNAVRTLLDIEIARIEIMERK